MKPGDRITIRSSVRDPNSKLKEVTLVDFDDQTVTVKIDGVGGLFTFAKSIVVENE